MADVQRMKCPECGHDNTMIGVINQVRQYVCHNCGERYYTPDDCFGTKKPEEKPGGKKD